MRILLVEDDLRLAERTAEYLRLHSFHVDLAHDSSTGIKMAESNNYDLVLLDWMLPKATNDPDGPSDGLDVCKRLRQSSTVPVIMLSARAEDVDRVVGLELGADDYLTKPFNPRELLARIRAVLRGRQLSTTTSSRSNQKPAAQPNTTLNSGALSMDIEKRSASYHEKSLELTSYQYELLWVLLRESPKVLKRQQLYAEVYKLQNGIQGEADLPDSNFDPSVDRSIDVHLSKIRQQLAGLHPEGKKLIQTIRGVGYVLGRDTDSNR